MGEIIERRAKWTVVAIAVFGLALRMAAAQGGLWLDEAWSAVMAQEAGTPLGIFLNINHDNNHHLNSLWLQLVGQSGPPMLQRALSIVAGTVTILIAARIGARRNAGTAILTALFLALSPLLVTYGSEARGYAPMLLALMCAADLVDRWLAHPATPPPAIALAIAALLGLLAHLTMAFGLVALGLWSLWQLRQQRAQLFGMLARLWGLAAMAAAIALALIFIPAWRSGGMAFGAAEPFTFIQLGAGLVHAFRYAFGGIWSAVAIIAPAAMLLGIPQGRLAACGYACLLAPPLLVLAAQMPNAGFARLYLIPATGALLLLALLLGNSFAQGKRVLPLLFAAATLLLMAWGTAPLIEGRRADPAQAIAAIAARTGTADLALDHSRSEATLRAAAASARYPLTIRQSCPAARFLFLERDGDAPFPATPSHCGARYRGIAGAFAQGLSGTHWKLYERAER
ncbi:hypothetical protein [Sphingomonas turrisvirgatae]|uniref:Glycosyltransferase RgtA/B/C/D-like domain-containing protein n=1 Tax=Sphingomonas turrisvirgatae TaxID=1888892 RepID=A0A1E3LSZ4_9SPHN|nr:hypothetical protein [Sphingomonas turrisvirgatae]ODP36824.1 hypothetical protein BFL28_03685 [Sphingomonas turrisvirgatae]